MSLNGQVADRKNETCSLLMLGRLRELELTLNRIEHACTHYDVLGVEIDSPNEDISISYNQAVDMLQPERVASAIKLPDNVILRVHRAVARLRHAFKVLSDEAKRLEYDEHLFAGSGVFATPVSLPEPEPRIVHLGASSPASKKSGSPVTADSFNPFDVRTERFGEFASIQDSDNRRRFERWKLSMPAYVTGNDRLAGEWHEITRTIDVSRTGALVRLRRRVRHRALLHLALPLPMRLRCYRHSEPSYSVYGLVRRIETPRDGHRVVGIEFVGECPPDGYIERPWATYATKWSGIERRRSPRWDISEVVRIEYLDERMRLLLHEEAVAENASIGGMRVNVKSAPPEFDMLRIKTREFESLATVCNRYVGKDRLERLCIQFAYPC